MTRAGVIVMNPDTGASGWERTFRYTEGAKEIASAGVPMLPIGGGNLVIFPEIKAKVIIVITKQSPRFGMKSLLDFEFAPIAFGWGFFEATQERVAEALVSWRSEHRKWASKEPVCAPLREALHM